jgi:putative intracellular protease/amidase
MDIVFLLFDGITPLDAIGPFEILGRLPGAKVKMVAKVKGPVRTRGGSLTMIADYALAEVLKPDLLLVPGGAGADGTAEDKAVTDWVAKVHQTTTWTTAVCTGALILGGAGVLKGLKATTHWRAMEDLKRFGALPVHDRVVRQGKVVTAAGVSSGLDMALMLASEIAGDEVAKAIQLGIEYAPEPPFDAGRIEDAPDERIRMARTGLSRP